ncbi:acyl-CoA dehydratase activase [Clostridium ganghwense]|uniref:Acyl-CoA dehydratase activase n=1 Tax=Clostridium ganghwense TaxID=312089 RepID=A0ABT4CQ84_9CLOT|nr:acyl-CoA dehydratase activase [Clostridium ganghwense]MCY6371207.1 acyl-CoA dehydratase activase [Clostridium ganghwense]
MIGYVCKYTPIDILESFGEKVIKIDPSISNFDNSDALMHPNMCFYSKSVLEYCLNNELNEIVLVNCCDSIRRLYDVLKTKKEFNFIHLIDVPHKSSCCSVELFKKELLRFIKHYEHYSGKIFNVNDFKNILLNKISNGNNKPANTTSLNIAVLGARCKNSLIHIIENCNVKVAYNFTCTGNNITYSNFGENEDLLTYYSQNLLKSFPCLRMAALNKRYEVINENKKNITGIIYHTVKFCDFYSYEYTRLKNKIHLPMLKIETDYTEQSEGQLQTRIEAFIESLKVKQYTNNNLSTKYKRDINIIVDKYLDKKLVMGIDSGSTSTNAVIMDENKKIISYSIVRTSAKSSIGAENAFKEALRKANITKKDISYIISTGYGRVSIPFANENVTEITCHAKGVHFLNERVRTIIDIGGQDSKTIRLDANGNVIDFAMNDKCAAGTGRFLEMMARTLEISIDELGPLSLKWKENINITSMCSVFAESEVISLIAQNKEKSDIIHGLCNSISSRTISLIDRIKREGAFMITGGVAKNIGVVKALEKKLKEKIYIPEEPEIVGALGAAIISLEKFKL